MDDGYQGPAPEDRGGCLIAAVVGMITLLFDVGRIMGDPAPGTEDLWWRQIPMFAPTLVIVTATFFLSRALILKGRSDDR